MRHHADVTCHEALTVMWPYLDDELDVLLATSVRRHLEICPGCGRRFASEARFLDLLSRATPLDVDVASLRERVLEALFAEGLPRPS